MRHRCMFCAQYCTTNLPSDAIVRGGLMCPECLMRMPEDQFNALRRPVYPPREGDPVAPDLEQEVRDLEKQVRHRGYFLFVYSSELDHGAMAYNFKKEDLREILGDLASRLGPQESDGTRNDS